MQRRFTSLGFARLHHTLPSARPFLLPLSHLRLQACSASSSQNTSAHGPSPLQQLYKSSHRGAGNTPMPKPFKQEPLRPRNKPIATAEALFTNRSSCAEDAGPVPTRPLSPLQKRQLLFKNKAAFTLSPQALRRVKFLLSQYPSHHAAETTDKKAGPSTSTSATPAGIRIGVRRRGCSGYSYTVNYYFPRSDTAVKAPARGAADVVVEQDGVKVVVDGEALFYVIGTEMDYVVRDVEEKFLFKNPNQKYGCGCEESFMPFDEDDLDE